MVRSFPSLDKNMLQLEMPRNIILSIYIHVYIVYYITVKHLKTRSLKHNDKDTIGAERPTNKGCNT